LKVEAEDPKMIIVLHYNVDMNSENNNEDGDNPMNIWIII